MHTFPECPEMAPEDENDLIEAVVTCEGNLHDPDFSVRFQAFLGNLKSILREEELLKVKKIEPWNSVRVTISIPKEAAQKLRLLAQQGSNVLRSLGILTVQVEGDQVISLTLAGQNNEPTEIVLRQSDGPSSSSSSSSGGGGPLSFPSLQSSLPMAPSGPNVPLAILSASSSSSSAFRSPNVVAPAGESIPVLPPKSTLANPRPAALGGQFPFTSMIHAAQTMQRTDPALQQNNNSSSSNLSNNNNVNENAVNSTNFPSSVPASSSSSPVTQAPQSSSSSFSTPPLVTSVSVSNSSLNPSLLTTQLQQQGHVKSEQVNRFVLQQHQQQQQQGRGPSGALQQQTSQASPQSQSLQFQIVNVNAPPPYNPGVHSSSSSSNPSGNLLSSNSFNHHHHQQLNSANNTNNSNVVAVSSSSSVTFVGAPPTPSSSNVTLVRSVSSPSMSSQILGDNLLLGVTQQQQQQPMSSPLLVNLLQNNEAMSPPHQQNSTTTSQVQQQQGQNTNIMLPPSTEQQKRFILHHQQHLQRKIKRGLSLDGASLGEMETTTTTGLKTRDLLIGSSLVGSGVGSGVSSEPASPAASVGVVGSSNSLDNSNNVFAQLTLPSSSSSLLPSSSSSVVDSRVNVPVSFQQRPSSELGTTATIIQGRTIIHQGNVRVFNPGQIRAIRLTQSNTSSSSPSTIHFIEGKPVMTTTSGETMGNCVVLNGPHPVMTPSPQNSGHHHQQFPASNTILTSATITSSNQQQQQQQQPAGNHHHHQEPNVLASAIRLVDQSSSRTSLNPPTKIVVSTSASNPPYNSNNSNMFIPPSQPLSSSSLSSSPPQTHQQQRLANLPSAVTHQQQQQRRQVVQSHEAKLTPSQHQQHHRGTLIKSSNRDPTTPQSQLTSSGKPRQLLINPLTGHLEPMPSESSSDSDEETDDRRRPQQRRVGPKGVGNSRGTIQHRQILTTTTTGVTVARVVKSTSLDSQKSSMEQEVMKRQQQQLIAQHQQQQQQRVMVVPVTVNNPSGPQLAANVSKKSREDKETTSSTQVTAFSLNTGPSGEKIKLRLKLEKSEPISPAYKVDVSFVKKSEKSLISSPSSSSATTTTTTGMSAYSPAPVGSPGEPPRVPPLHISLRGKNAAVVSSPRREDFLGGKGAAAGGDEDNTSSFPFSLYDGKLTNTLMKVGKRTKNRVKSSGCESDPEGGITHIKNPAKLSRPRLSKDSSSLSGVDSFIMNSTDGNHPDTLKARLEGSNPAATTTTTSLSSSLCFQPLIITPVSVTGSNSKDLISGSISNASATLVSSSIPSPTVKLKKSRRKSESEMINRLLPPPPSTSAPSSTVPGSEPTTTIFRSLAKISEDTSEASSLLFKHLSKKDENVDLGVPSVSVTVSQTVTTTTTSLAPIGLHSTSVKETMVLDTVTTTSVLTLTSTTTGASLTTLSQGVHVTAMSKPIPSPLPSLGNNPMAVFKDSNTLSIVPSESIGQPNIPMLNRENIPKELDLASTRTISVVTGIPETKTTTTPTSKSPKPLPDLLALPSKVLDEKSEARHEHLANSISNEQHVFPPVSIPSNMTINKISVPVAPPLLHSPKIQSTLINNDDNINIPSNSEIIEKTIVAPVIPQSTPPLQIVSISKQPSLMEEKSLPVIRSNNPSVIYRKTDKGTGLGLTGLVKIKGNPSTILRPKVQTPRVSIGTSIDADLPTLTPSPSLRELLEKEKSLDTKKDLPSTLVIGSVAANKVNIEEQKSNLNLGDNELSIIMAQSESKNPPPPPTLPVIEEKSESRTESQAVINKSEDAIVVPVIVEVDNANGQCVPEMLELTEPLPSTVTPNAPLPFPLVLPKGEDQSGIPGEDSGIDSMDALSEKSPNQGESPARKEIEQFGESHHNLPHYDPVSSVVTHHHQDHKTQCIELKVDPEPLPAEVPKLESSLDQSTTTTIQLTDKQLETASVQIEKDESLENTANIKTDVETEGVSVVVEEQPNIELQDIHKDCEPQVEELVDDLTKETPVNPNPLPDPPVEEPPTKKIKTEAENPPDVSKEAITDRKAVPTVIERVGTPSADQRVPLIVSQESPEIIESSVVNQNESPNDEPSIIPTSMENLITEEEESVQSKVDSVMTETLEVEMVPVSESVVETSDIQAPSIDEISSKTEPVIDEVSSIQETVSEQIKPAELAPGALETETNIISLVFSVPETTPVIDEVEKELESVQPPVIIGNHVDAIQELHQHLKLPQQQHQVVKKKDNVKVRKAKLEDIVAAIGTKNIERQQQAKSEPFDVHESEQQTETTMVQANPEDLSVTIPPVPKLNVEDLSVPSDVHPVLVDANECVEEKLAVHTNEETSTISLQEQKLALPEEKGKKETELLDLSIQPAPTQKEVLEQLKPGGSLPNPSEPEAVVQNSDGFTIPVPSLETQQKIENINQEQEDRLQLSSCKELDSSLPLPNLEMIPTSIPEADLIGKPELSDTTDSVTKSEVKPELPKIVELPKETINVPVVEPVLNLEIKVTPKPINTETTTGSLITAPVSVPPPISIVLPARTVSPQKPVLEPQTPTPSPRYKQRGKLKPGPSSPGGRRILDGPPKLSKATETDPRPESANPPRLEMRRVEGPLNLPTLSISPNTPAKIQIHTVAPTTQLPVVTSVNRNTPPNMIHLTKAAATQAMVNKIQATGATLANALPASLSSISLPLQASQISTTAGGPLPGQTVFAIHPNVTLPANLSHLQSHGPASITVLPGGHKMVPIKLVTLPKQSSNQFQTLSLAGCTTSRGSPNILEAVNIVTNSGSRSNSPKTIIGNSIHQGPTALNLSSMSLTSGDGKLHLVPLSMSSAVGGTSNPVKVIVSTPIKMQQSMMMKSVVVGQQQQQATTIRVVRPMESVYNSGVVKPLVQQGLVRPITTITSNPPPPITVVQTAVVDNNPSTVPSVKAEIVTVEKRAIETKVVADSIYKHVDGLEILDSALPQMNEDDLPFEADIIHDEKDLEDVLAGESFETVVRENGIDGLHSPYDIENENFGISSEPPSRKPQIRSVKESNEHLKSAVKLNNQHENNKERQQSVATDESAMPDSPIPAMRSSSPLFTYGNRSAKNSRPSSRSPSPTESDVHGEDQEIIDSFTRSPSQPKLSPQNRPDNYERTDEYGSPLKPDLTAADHEEARERTLNEELSIEIPPVELMVMSPSQQQQQTEERKSTRSTRSNTRLVSPDITAFRSDTPKPAKFSSKPDTLVFKNSPKPSPTGSLKMLSPNVTGLTITPSSSNRSSPILPNQVINAQQQHPNSVASGAVEKIAATNVIVNSNSTNSTRVNKGGSNKRKRQESDSSNASKDENAEEKVEIDLNARPGKRRCSENAAELIKACIGIEDTPKRNSMLIKKMEESKLKEAKMKKAMATLIEENEGDNESVETSLSRGRAGRSSRASSEDRSSSRGSSVQRNSGSSKASSKDEDHLKEQKATTKVNNRSGKEKQKLNSGRESPNRNSTGTKKGAKAAGRRSNRGTLVRDKSPLTPAKTRTNVRKESGTSTIVSDKTIGTATTTTSPPETENLRRKTRSCAAGKRLHVDTPDSDLASMKRRRVSKDAKS